MRKSEIACFEKTEETCFTFSQQDWYKSRKPACLLLYKLFLALILPNKNARSKRTFFNISLALSNLFY
jgi:hypothetical protein